MKNLNVTTTHHSFLRQERMNTCSLEQHRNYAERAWKNGKKATDYTGKAFRYLSDLETRHGDTYTVRVFSKFCFIFSDEGVLITLYPVNQKLLAHNRPKSSHIRDEEEYLVSDFLFYVLKKKQKAVSGEAIHDCSSDSNFIIGLTLSMYRFLYIASFKTSIRLYNSQVRL